MSRIAAHSKTLPASSHNTQQMPLTVSMVIGIAGLFLFLSSQVVVAAGAAVWAIGKTFHLGVTGFAVLAAIAAVPAAFALWKILVMAIAAERDPANN